ncbi:hypothetical protein GCM10011348_39250 [Marinobacterium nitratireducens]|uniref:Uncharacterized protein n=1 Tax=Marinobacterium nitratireducens TaxID=518897 RepID=A0A917ZMZ7_9GAMM|nr:multidrug transporter [Marinobacterium nitratireducens]GGO87025.1 hypothetical protein GCM10011348_39250 [Marinobacterium nitratireducens]
MMEHFVCKRPKPSLWLVVLLLGISTSLPLRAQERGAAYRLDACDMVVETLICRPAGLVATLIGTTVWAVSLPFSLAGGNEKEARKALIYEPAAYTFKRPVGSPECSCGGYQDP